MNDWVTTLLASGGAAVTLAAIVTLVGTLRTLRANQPLTKGQAESAQAAANAQNIAAQSGVIETLNRENKRLSDSLDRLLAKVSELETRLDGSDLREEALIVQNKILREHDRRLGDWAKRYYEAGHPPGMEPPPLIVPMPPP